jgi:amino acid adenylation domain-containing protein
MSQDIFKEVLFSHDDYRTHLEYWSKIVSRDLAPIDLPMDRPPQADHTPAEPDSLRFPIPPSLTGRLLHMSKGADLTLFVLLLTGFTALLSRVAAEGELVFATPLLKRKSQGDQKAQYNDMVLFRRPPAPPGTTFKQLLMETKGHIQEAYKYQDYPLDLVFRKQGLDIADYPFLDLVTVRLDALHQAPPPIEATALALVFSRDGDRLEGEFRFDRRLFERDFIAHWRDWYLRLMENALDHLDDDISSIEILSPQESDKVLKGFNGTAVDLDATATLQEMVTRQVKNAPDRIALAGEIQVSYGELDRRASVLARRLRRHGVGPDSIVAIVMEPSPHMIAAILGVLQAGGAYCPINPSYPDSRIETMLADCNASVVVSGGREFEHIKCLPLLGFDRSTVKPHLSAPRPQVKDLDSLQFCDRSLIKYERYRPYIAQAMVKNSMAIHMSRGCAYHCAYCFKIWPDHYVMRSAENIFQEIKLYYDMGIRRFAFVDDLPNIDVKESAKLYELIIQHNMDVHLHYPNGIRGDVLTKDYIDLMVEAGTVNMDFALETTAPRLQKLLRKHLKIDRLLENIQYVIERHPHVITEIQILHGIPSETVEEARHSLDCIKSLQWIDFPYIHILKIGLNSDMARIALDHGISPQAIRRSAELFIHDLPDTLPFPKSFTRDYKAEFVNEYFMNRDRLIQRLPHQMAALTESELVQRYNNYLPVEISNFDDLLDYSGIDRRELDGGFLPPDYGLVPDLDRQLADAFPQDTPDDDAVNVLMLDLSQYFSGDTDLVYDVVEPPLGLMYVMTHLKKTFPRKVRGQLAKSRIDFDSFGDLREMIGEFKPHIIGIRTLNAYRDFFHKTVYMLRQWGVEAIIVAGGPYATSSVETVLRDRRVDLAVVGEGEVTFAQLVEAVLKNRLQLPPEKVLEDIPGLAWIPAAEQETLHRSNRDIILADGVGDSKEYEGESTAGQEDLAYIIYTSGTSGVPKGVAVQQNNAVNQIAGLIRRFGFTPDLHYILLASFTFDVSVMHIFSALGTGAKLHIIDETVLRDPSLLWQFAARHQVDVLNIVPAFMKMVLKHRGTKNLPLKHLFVGGDVFGSDLYRELEGAFPHAQIINIYGPTETTINATAYVCGSQNCDGPIPIGNPLDNYTTYVLDRNQQVLPPRVKGELWIGGNGVARGYLNRPELSHDTFARVPSLPGRLYRSGDMARFLEDGAIEFFGRKDQQVKIRGFRLELGEIEYLLQCHEDVAQAVVTARPAQDGDRGLAAYVVPVDSIHGREFDPSGLRDYLARQLPPFMIPAHFIKLEQIPVTERGKLDIDALPAPKRTARRLVEPRNGVERTLAGIWAGVIDMEPENLGIDDNFFELGGHSLKATILGARIHKELHVKIPIVDLFKLSTIRAQAEFVRQAETRRFSAIRRVEERAYYPCSSAQKRLYVAQHMNVESAAYNMPVLLELTGSLDPSTLEETFKTLIQRHESLRTCFASMEGEPVQQILEDVEFAVQRFDLQGIAPERIKEDIDRIVGAFIRPFVLEHAPLFRAGLIQLSPTNHILMVDMHHIVTDGTSMSLLVQDFMTLQEGGALRDLPLRYRDFAVWQQSESQLAAARQQEEYWLRQFNGDEPPLDMPLDFPRPAKHSHDGAVVRLEIDEELTAGICRLLTGTGATMYMFLLAVYDILLSKYSGQDTIVVGTGVAGRQHADLEGVMGMFINILPMKNRPVETKTFTEFLREVKQTSLQAFDNQDYQFDQLVEKLGIQRSANRNPLFDAEFTMQNVEIRQLEIPGLVLRPYGFRVDKSRFDLALHATHEHGVIRLMMTYASTLFKHDTAQGLLNHLMEIARQAAERPDMVLGDIQLSGRLSAARAKMQAQDAQFDF